MVKIVNTYARSNPISTALTAMIKGQGGGSRRGPYDDALDREKLYEAQRKRIELENLARMTVDPNRDETALMGSTILSDYDPQKYNVLRRGHAAREYGAGDQRTTDAFVGAGSAYSGTYQGYQTSEANKIRMNDADNAAAMDRTMVEDTRKRHEFAQKPVEAYQDGQPRFVPQSQVFSANVQPPMSYADVRGRKLQDNFGSLADIPIEEQRVLGADPGSSQRTPRNYLAPDGGKYITYDGTTDARSGAPLPVGGHLYGLNADSAEAAGLTTSTQSELQKSTIALNSFQGTLSRARAIAQQDPTLFGVTGVVRSLAQGGAEALNNVGLLLGNENVGQTIAELRSIAANSPNLQDKSLVAGLFDPNIPGIRVLADLLVFKAAAALAGQSGRSVSDRDVQMFRRIVGDPRAFLESQASFLAKMDIMEKELQAQIALERRAMGGDLSAAPGEGVATERPVTNEITIDAEGNIIE